MAAVTLGAADEPFVDWDWVSRHLDDVRSATYEHLRLTLLAVGIGFLISAALGLVALRWRPTLGPITWITGLLYTIPSLALFAFLVPVFGLSTLTGEIGLVSYTLLILVRNIVAGVDGVPPAVREAADGMGYTATRRTFAVDLRLATPAIIAGLRIATVTTVGLVTVTALVGLGGYGDFIADGLSRNFPTPIVLGAGLSVLMAVAFDVALVGLERVLTPWRRDEGGQRRIRVEPGNVATAPTVATVEAVEVVES
jgi:osmoprotectant transport system permease protein